MQTTRFLRSLTAKTLSASYRSTIVGSWTRYENASFLCECGSLWLVSMETDMVDLTSITHYLVIPPAGARHSSRVTGATTNAAPPATQSNGLGERGSSTTKH